MKWHPALSGKQMGGNRMILRQMLVDHAAACRPTRHQCMVIASQQGNDPGASEIKRLELLLIITKSEHAKNDAGKPSAFGAQCTGDDQYLLTGALIDHDLRKHLFRLAVISQLAEIGTIRDVYSLYLLAVGRIQGVAVGIVNPVTDDFVVVEQAAVEIGIQLLFVKRNGFMTQCGNRNSLLQHLQIRVGVP